MSNQNVDSSLNNVGDLLTNAASQFNSQMAVAEATRRRSAGGYIYNQIQFGELDRLSDSMAAGFQKLGIPAGTRICLMIPPGIEFVALVFALFKARLVAILIDPGMGRNHLIDCLADVSPEGFITIPKGHLARVLYRKRFPNSRFHVVTRGWFPFCHSLHQIGQTDPAELNRTDRSTDDVAAVIFTTGSTGVPKGVEYLHRNFLKQASEIVGYFNIQPGGVDISAFPLFALFNISTGCSTVFPKMDFTQPAKVDPRAIIEAAADWEANQSFGSPALWNTVSRYAESQQCRIPSLTKVLSAGAPVPVHVLRRVQDMIHPDGILFTPYGATEALPVACADSQMILGETAEASEQGKGTCVGSRFPGIDWKVIEIVDGEIPEISQVREVPSGETGELLVKGDVVTQRYITRVEANAEHKVRDGDLFWHRMGDVGYLDDKGRFWFCGRKAHRVLTPNGTLFTVPVEAIFNRHPKVYRSALIGIGPAEVRCPAIAVELWSDQFAEAALSPDDLFEQLRQLATDFDHTREIETFYLFEELPTDIRHNSKIFREKITTRINKTPQTSTYRK